MSTSFYLNQEDDILRKEIYKISTPSLCESTGIRTIHFYPEYLSTLLNQEFDFKNYTFNKFKRLTTYLLDSMSKNNEQPQ